MVNATKGMLQEYNKGVQIYNWVMVKGISEEMA